MRAAVAFIAGIFAVFSVAATAAAEEVPKPKGECGGSYFQQYLKEPGRKAFAYAERNLSTTLRHRRFLFTDSFLLLWKWRVG